MSEVLEWGSKNGIPLLGKLKLRGVHTSGVRWGPLAVPGIFSRPLQCQDLRQVFLGPHLAVLGGCSRRCWGNWAVLGPGLGSGAACEACDLACPASLPALEGPSVQRIAGKGRGKRKQQGWGGEGAHSWELKRNLPGGIPQQRGPQDCLSPATLSAVLVGPAQAPPQVFGDTKCRLRGCPQPPAGPGAWSCSVPTANTVVMGRGGPHGTEGN